MLLIKKTVWLTRRNPYCFGGSAFHLRAANQWEESGWASRIRCLRGTTICSCCSWGNLSSMIRAILISQFWLKAQPLSEVVRKQQLCVKEKYTTHGKFKVDHKSLSIEKTWFVWLTIINIFVNIKDVYTWKKQNLIRGPDSLLHIDTETISNCS